MTVAKVRARGAQYLITTEYVSGIRYDTRPNIIAEVRADPRAEVVAIFSPFSPPEARPKLILEPHNAWYMTFARFDQVVRPGPIMTIYNLDARPPGGALSPQ